MMFDEGHFMQMSPQHQMLFIPPQPQQAQPQAPPPPQPAVPQVVLRSTLAHVAPDDDETVAKIAANNKWHLDVGATQTHFDTLDMSGVSLTVLPAPLFTGLFANITNLYLGSNKLSTFPAGLLQMTQLQCLHLEKNQLKTLPPEIHRLRELRELDVSGNELVELPRELGHLYKLWSLEFANNSVELLPSDVACRDTRGVVRYLLDQCPPPAPPAERRQWRSENACVPGGGPVLRVMTYNILAKLYCTEHMYPYCPTKALDADYRRSLALEQVFEYNADIVCLQEVDSKQFCEIDAAMRARGYDSYFEKKTRPLRKPQDDGSLIDGCATFWKTAKIALLDKSIHAYQALSQQRFGKYAESQSGVRLLCSKEHIAVATVFETKTPVPRRFALSNTHIFWDPAYEYVKLMQAQIQIEELLALQRQYTADAAHPLPLIITGDYNSTPDSGVYELFSTGRLSPDHPHWHNTDFGKYTREGIHNPQRFASAYAAHGEPEYTNCAADFCGTLDYIWTTPESVRPVQVLDVIPMSKLGLLLRPFPNTYFPSDHVPLVADLQLV